MAEIGGSCTARVVRVCEGSRELASVELAPLDHLEELPGNHLLGGYGPPPGEGVGTLR